MRLQKRILLGVGIAAAGVGGGFGIAAAATSSSNPARVAAPPAAATPAAAPAAAPAAQSAPVPAGSATINVTTASVGGKSEQVLVNSRGLPLYTYASDSGKTSRVSGGLAALWPPLDSASPTESGASGKLSVVTDANGQQVQYNGHFLYTFIDDTPGQVTGQGVQNFFVATPGLSAAQTNPAQTNPAPAPVSNQSSGYGY